MNRRCPVCRRVAVPTTQDNIYRHTDTLGQEICPMSGEPYRCTEVGRPSRVRFMARKDAA